MLQRRNAEYHMRAHVQGIAEMQDPETQRKGDQFDVRFLCLMWTFGVPAEHAARISYGEPSTLPYPIMLST